MSRPQSSTAGHPIVPVPDAKAARANAPSVSSAKQLIDDDLTHNPDSGCLSADLTTFDSEECDRPIDNDSLEDQKKPAAVAFSAADKHIEAQIDSGNCDDFNSQEMTEDDVELEKSDVNTTPRQCQPEQKITNQSSADEKLPSIPHPADAVGLAKWKDSMWRACYTQDEFGDT